jgi:phthiodiolone/phenolphthiodiolone dimycocerosates ketoreductase
MARLKFGALLGIFRARETVELGIEAEKLGFDSVLVADHLIDTPPPGASMVDPWTVLAALGEHTKKILLCTAVTQYQQYHPAKLAQMLATLDDLTHGRVGLGIGAGEVMNTVPFGMEWEESSVRAEKLREFIKVVKLLWTSIPYKSTVNFEGKYYRLVNARLDQSPVQKPHPPIYIGALGSRRLLELVGEMGNGWIPVTSCPEIYAKRLEVIKRAAEKAGRKIKDIDLGVWLMTAVVKDPKRRELIKEKALKFLKTYLTVDRYQLRMLGYEALPLSYQYQHLMFSPEEVKVVMEAREKIPDEIWKKRFMAVGTPEEIIEIIEQYASLGATHIFIRDSMYAPEFNAMADTLNAVSREIMPYFKEREK